jgi:digeranylgeranylglycerophospholipid reductase
MTKFEADILVVGGGPAGLSAAESASAAGATVVLFEKSKEIGYPIHTSGGSWIEDLRALGVPERFMHPVHVGRFIAPSAEATFEYEKPVACVLDVRGLYQHLAERAVAAGAAMRLQSIAQRPILRGDAVTGVEVSHHGQIEQWQGKVVIDASGAQAVLARKAGLAEPLSRYGIGAEFDLYAPGWPDHHVVFLFGSQVAPAGYAWLFSRGSGRVRAGVGLIRPESKDDPRPFLDHLLSRTDILDGALAGASPIEVHIGTIPSQPPLSKTVHDGLIVVGDAGGLISTLLGEGIRYAIDLGRLAGAVAAAAVQRGDVSSRGLHEFERGWREKYGRVFSVGWTLNQRLSRYSDHDWDEKIALLARLDADLVPPILRGEFDGRLLWKLLRRHPGLVGRESARRLQRIWRGKG